MLLTYFRCPRALPPAWALCSDEQQFGSRCLMGQEQGDRSAGLCQDRRREATGGEATPEMLSQLKQHTQGKAEGCCRGGEKVG